MRLTKTLTMKSCYKKTCNTPRFHRKLSSVTETAESVTAVSMTLQSFFAHANISEKSKLYAKILQRLNTGPCWLRIIKNEDQKLVTLSLKS